MSNFYQWVSKLLTTMGSKNDAPTFPQLPMPSQTAHDHFESYRVFITEHYQEKGDTVWEYSKEKGLEGNQINLIIKEKRTIFLIHTKEQSEDISIHDIHNFEKESNHFLKTHPIFEHYTIHLLYVMPSLLLDESSYKYIKQNSHISYKIIK